MLILRTHQKSDRDLCLLASQNVNPVAIITIGLVSRHKPKTSG